MIKEKGYFMDNLILESFHSGHCLNAYQLFGAISSFEGREGVRFTVWAPHALRVEVIGTFNDWNGNNYQMNKISEKGVWSLFVPNLEMNHSYKYRICTHDHRMIDKADPFAFCSELRPATASLTYNLDGFKWNDKKWLKSRDKNFNKAVNIYEVHAGSWKTNVDGSFYTYNQLIKELIPYVKEYGFTHIEFMPLSEHPFDGSWGYQTSGYFSCTSRYGTPKDFMKLVSECHKNGIGVIMDMVPVHYVKDDFGLRYFDGEPLFEYEDPDDAFSQWGTMNFDLWKEEVRSFVMSAAAFWCDVYHIDGLRFDAVSHLIHWDGNSDRGENEGSITFVKRMNYYLNENFPDVMLIAEDSSDYANVTKSTLDSGLGFDYKWDLGWMNDTLSYYQRAPDHRKYHHNEINFSMAYFYYENFLLPLSHDEVVHGKKTLIDKMWGDYEQKFAQVKNLYLYLFTHPGKKLNFMGNEISMFREWDELKELDWFMLEYPIHDAFSNFFKEISNIYTNTPALSCNDYNPESFKWIDADNNEQSIFSYYREDSENIYVVILNMNMIEYEKYEIGVPIRANYIEILNTEKDIYNGCNLCNFEPLKTVKESKHKLPYKINLQIAPFAGILLHAKKRKPRKKTIKTKTKK
jgi:1,4-alpha-glucan branching enzyme